MTYTVRTADRMWTEAVYTDFCEMIRDWARELKAGTHYYIMEN